MDDLDRYLEEQMKDPEFRKEYEASRAEFEALCKQIQEEIDKRKQ